MSDIILSLPELQSSPLCKKPVLITGAAGFVGFYVSRILLENGVKVIGVDNMNDYYDPSLKEARLYQLRQYPDFSFYRVDLADSAEVAKIFDTYSPHGVIHLAAQAGVRYSLENPQAYNRSNLTGFLNILEGVRKHKPLHTIYASSSSVYGANQKIPFSAEDRTDHPVSLYAATKKANEAMAFSYAEMYKIPLTGLRFFTVYGPFGRPDMAYFSFTKNISEGKTINVFNHGEMMRDFTYIDDIAEGVVRLFLTVPKAEEHPHRLFNIGNNKPEKLGYFIECLEEILGKQAVKNFLPMQTGDVPATYADIDPLMNLTGFKPKTDLKTGLTRFVKWYRDYYEKG